VDTSTYRRESAARLLALPALLLGCAINAVPHAPYLRAAETRGRVFPGHPVVTSDLLFKNLDPDHAAYYLVNPDQLARVRGSRALTYLGTQNHFHFLRTWTKVVDSRDEVLFVALDSTTSAAFTATNTDRSRSTAGPATYRDSCPEAVRVRALPGRTRWCLR
jgi:hypothetical protein